MEMIIKDGPGMLTVQDQSLVFVETVNTRATWKESCNLSSRFVFFAVTFALGLMRSEEEGFHSARRFGIQKFLSKT